MSHPNNTANFNSVGEKSVILHSLWFGGTWYIYIMGVSQLHILNSWIRIQLMNLDLNVQFFSTKDHCVAIGYSSFASKKDCFSTVVANKSRWRADGHTHQRNIANLGRMWLTMKNHDNVDKRQFCRCIIGVSGVPRGPYCMCKTKMAACALRIKCCVLESCCSFDWSFPSRLTWCQK